MQILVVEDDERIASFLAKGLAADGYSVVVAVDDREAMTALVDGDDLAAVLLDLTLPRVDGMEILAKIRAEQPDLPVLIVTARGEISDRIRGLDAGANDYIVKPFAFEELVARLRAALRASDGRSPSSTSLTVADLSFDLVTKVARRGDRAIELTRREWALLELFMRHPTQILSRVQILNRVWDFGFDPGSNVVDVYVGYLRRKLNGPGDEPLLTTIRGAGYRLVPPR